MITPSDASLLEVADLVLAAADAGGIGIQVQHGDAAYQNGVAQRVTSHRSFLDGAQVAATQDTSGARVAFIIDDPRRRDVEAALRDAESRFRALVEAIPEAVAIFTEAGVVYSNPAAATMFGFASPAETIGRNVLEIVAEPDHELAAKRIGQLLRGVPTPPQEYRVKGPDGVLRTLEISSIPTEYEGRPAVLSYGRDVSERRELEGQLVQSDRLATLGFLAGSIAHAINNPLTYVLLNLEHVANRLEAVQGDRAALAEALVRLREAHHGAERVATVVKQMRAFARSDERPASAVDIRRVLETGIALVGNELRHRGRLVTEYAEVPAVNASPSRLEQAFLNLLVFAAQALSEEDAGSEVRVTVGSEADHVVVELHYTGEAIPESRRQYLFDPFATDDAGEPIGNLSLALSQSIVLDMGGALELESHDGVTFRVKLPAARTKPRSSRPPARQDSLAEFSGRARVLVIDDDPGVASALRVMLEEDHDVTSIANSREALRRLLRDGQFDIVFCDLMMPELTGMDLYEALRLNCPGRERKLVFMTGGAFTREAEAFLRQVPNPRVEKPFDLKTLQKLLRRAANADDDPWMD